ncbi:hypothetical protein MTBPR1_140069 [Candidatus Terasakiella magnetica]|uniref:Uncharacterized protein n=1 Tax=Candidatus Terasakiella magnetica TaxID=1867952 RepID=A0A1C3RFC2_9PROT|nr:hypothetical protein [Candidatus Terasakiella magnetica]SCA55951.1 hypothetical protein MTBPR1_140069 [Candidatus Terasakiella magnetica]
MSKQTQQGHELTEEQILDFGLDIAPVEAGRSIEEIVINLEGKENEQRNINKEERN